MYDQVFKIVREFQGQINEVFARFKETAELKLADMRDHFSSVSRFYNGLMQQTRKRYDAITARKEYERQRICKLLTRKCKIPPEQLDTFAPEREQDVTRCLQMLHNVYFVRKIAGRYRNEADFSYEAMRKNPELLKLVCINAADREQLEYRQKVWYWLGCTALGQRALLEE